ncbi:hypothetical protein TNCV_2278371 [Trichonephila clavipes]|uniref:Uncharacterized protein n=1 Tax=Trichonephila clavipes TaxID=2585209 RepID=A0A8X6UY48_TRICX|nr:hypothetical protein TNCV_2278371 [Trichonephila clavipes]
MILQMTLAIPKVISSEGNHPWNIKTLGSLRVGPSVVVYCAVYFVVEVIPSEDYGTTGRWLVKVRNIHSDETAEEIFDGVMGCVLVIIDILSFLLTLIWIYSMEKLFIVLNTNQVPEWRIKEFLLWELAILVVTSQQNSRLWPKR